MLVGRERPDFGNRLVPPAQEDGFPMLDFFEITRKMGLGFMYIKFFHD